MNVFIDCKCKKCGEFIQLWFDNDTGTLHGTKCQKCDAELTDPEKEKVWHACDTLLSMKDHVTTFKVNKLHFIGSSRANKSRR